MVRWVVGSIPHGGTIELFLVPASAPRLVCAILSVGMVNIKEPISRYLNRPLPYVLYHITVNKMC